MKRMGMAVLALGLIACGVRAQEAPAKAPAAPPAKAPAAAPGKAPATQTPAPASAFKTQKEKLSYAIGMEMGKGVKAQGIDVDPTLLVQGLNDAISGGKPKMSEDELKQVITALQQDIRQKQTQAQQATAVENKTKGDAFLAENAKKDGVVALPDGLQYNTVLCNYKGTFLDGTEFDSSAQAGKPVPFEVSKVIPGFKEVLQLMPVGSKWQVFIPSGLGYGERGAGGVIGPNATLIFEIELVGIQDNAPPTAIQDSRPSSGPSPANGQPTK
jgi:FKBP-type peptidyl-prolyl cis-trans isomerase FklB